MFGPDSADSIIGKRMKVYHEPLSQACHNDVHRKLFNEYYEEISLADVIQEGVEDGTFAMSTRWSSRISSWTSSTQPGHAGLAWGEGRSEMGTRSDRCVPIH